MAAPEEAEEAEEIVAKQILRPSYRHKSSCPVSQDTYEEARKLSPLGWYVYLVKDGVAKVLEKNTTITFSKVGRDYYMMSEYFRDYKAKLPDNDDRRVHLTITNNKTIKFERIEVNQGAGQNALNEDEQQALEAMQALATDIEKQQQDIEKQEQAAADVKKQEQALALAQEQVEKQEQALADIEKQEQALAREQALAADIEKQEQALAAEQDKDDEEQADEGGEQGGEREKKLLAQVAVTLAAILALQVVHPPPPPPPPPAVVHVELLVRLEGPAPPPAEPVHLELIVRADGHARVVPVRTEGPVRVTVEDVNEGEINLNLTLGR